MRGRAPIARPRPAYCAGSASACGAGRVLAALDGAPRCRWTRSRERDLFADARERGDAVLFVTGEAGAIAAADAGAGSFADACAGGCPAGPAVTASGAFPGVAAGVSTVPLLVEGGDSDAVTGAPGSTGAGKTAGAATGGGFPARPSPSVTTGASNTLRAITSRRASQDCSWSGLRHA